jgi:regulator of protease activity HflC (stomatin/prohibitin superfamily)
MFNRILIRKHERGLRFRRGDFIAPVGPGSYTVFNPPWDSAAETIEVVDTLKTRFEHPLFDVLVRDHELREHLVVTDLADNQRAIVTLDGRLLTLLGPGRHAFWNTPGKVEIEVVRIDKDNLLAPGGLRLDHARINQIAALPNAALFVDAIVVAEHEQAVVFLDGRLLETLGPGRHLYWKGFGRISQRTVDLRELSADVAGQEIISADKVSLRVNLVVTWQVTDILRAVNRSQDPAQALYREAQLVLRSAVGTRTIDQLLEGKDAVGREILDGLVSRTRELGLTVRGVGLRDIILPGDMRNLFNQVIAATKEAEANLIRRREETAAARSQANTARLLAEHPELLRLRELEMLKEVLAGTTTTFVLGQGNLTGQIRSLVAAK